MILSRKSYVYVVGLYVYIRVRGKRYTLIDQG